MLWWRSITATNSTTITTTATTNNTNTTNNNTNTSRMASFFRKLRLRSTTESVATPVSDCQSTAVERVT